MSIADPLDALATAIADVDALDLEAAAERELGTLVSAIGRVERQLAARRLAVVAELDRRRRGQGDPTGRTTRQQLTRDGLTQGQARRQLDTANALADLPATRQALADGQISAAHAEQIARAAGQTDDVEGRDRIDRTGAVTATTTDPWQLRKALDTTLAELAPDLAEAQEAHAIRNRSLRTWGTDDGMVAGQFRLPRHHGEAVQTALSALSRRHSRHDDRTLAQRQADALTHMATSILDNGDTGQEGGYVPHVSLVVDLGADADGTDDQPLTGSLAHCGTVSERMVQRLGCDASVARIITRGPGRVLDVGRAQRTATTAQRRALTARDRGCIGCQAPPGWCQAHHIRWWRHGGRTDIVNLALVCWSCHDKIHHLGWQVITSPDGTLALVPPDGTL